jgi:hypothetical protein
MTEVLNLQALRGIVGNVDGELYYAKGHTSAGDGGGGIFMWRTGNAFKTNQTPPPTPPTSGIYSVDNYGTIIQAIIGGIPNDTGRWIRQYDGYISVVWFGAFGTLDTLPPESSYNVRIQNAIDYAALNAKINPTLKSSTVFIPNGSYQLSNIILKSGVTILGESIANTIIYATQGTGYLFEMEIGTVQLNILNLGIVGNGTNKGCFLFEAKPGIPTPIDPVADGGLWNSTIKNIGIGGFNGNGVYLKGGTTLPGQGASLTPNQFNIFENVRIRKNNDTNFTFFSNSLKMTGQIGQQSFINCQFDGYSYYLPDPNNPGKYIGYYDKSPNVSIENIVNDYLTSNVVTFLNCTIQDSDYGVRINYAENVTFDNCWFENLGVAITVLGDKERSKSINILNNRFANASGFGSLLAPNNIKAGQCVSVSKSVVNIYNNYITASDPNSADNIGSFVLGFPDNNGINCYNNSFRDNNPKLSKTYGIMQTVNIVATAIDCKSNKLIFINPTNPVTPTIIKNITSAINAGEILNIRANGLTVTFNNTGNIFLSNRTSFVLANAEIASFIKIDVGTNNETYQLLSFTKTTP